MSVKRFPADIAFSNAMRESYDYTCQHCRKNFRHNTGGLHNAHIHTRKHRNTRWCADYGSLAICASCHSRFTDFPVEWGDFLREYMGDDNYDESKRRAWTIRKFTKSDRADIAKHYRAEVKRIEFLRSQGQQGHIKLVSYE